MEGKTIEIKQAKFNPVGSPHLSYSTKEKDDKLPNTESAVGDYALKLSFGKAADGFGITSNPAF